MVSSAVSTLAVIDVGCAAHGPNRSVSRLARMFRPSYLLGLDPHPTIRTRNQTVSGVPVRILSVAAWTYDGEVGYVENGTRSRIDRGYGTPVRCVDLARLVSELTPVVVKLDVEGGEYTLLRHLIDREVDELVDVLLVEWHEPDDGAAEILERWSGAEVREWTW